MTVRDSRVGIGYDIHRLVEGRPLRLGAVEIRHDRGLAGHSDGDVLCHSIADAILGAAGLGEIGRLFPDEDPAFAGISGGAILAGVASRLASAGYRVGNVDAVVIAERPRLAAHVEGMRQAIASALAADPARISIKIKSNEGCDAIGRGDAIAAQAVARIEPA